MKTYCDVNKHVIQSEFGISLNNQSLFKLIMQKHDFSINILYYSKDIACVYRLHCCLLRTKVSWPIVNEVVG